MIVMLQRSQRVNVKYLGSHPTIRSSFTSHFSFCLLPGQSKVGQLNYLVFSEKKITWFQVAVHDAITVQMFHGSTDIQCEI
nr:hypothetical protein Iba_chr10bCG5990 [Ipomoea batatas]